MSWDERDPHGAEDQHTEGDKFRLIECIRKFASEERQEKAEEGQYANIAQDQVKPRRPWLLTLHNNLSMQKQYY